MAKFYFKKYKMKPEVVYCNALILLFCSQVEIKVLVPDLLSKCHILKKNITPRVPLSDTRRTRKARNLF